MRSFERNVKAISPVLAVLMMIAVAIAGSLITYAWVTGYIGFTTEKAGKAIMVQSIANADNDLLVYVQNVGEGVVELDPDSSVYRNGELFPCGITIGGVPVAAGENGLLSEGDTAELTLTDGAAEAGEKVTIKVTTLLGTFTEKSTYPATAGGGGPSGPTIPADWWDEDWKNRTLLTVAAGQVTVDLTDFPMLVDVTLDENYIQTNGQDIRFVSSSETSLAFEIESYDDGTGHLIAWVKTSLSSSADTDIWIYYGNDAATDGQQVSQVWSNGYVAVYHMNQDPSTGSILDSTTNPVSLTDHGMSSSALINDGQIGQALSFDGSNDYLDATNAEFDITGNALTLESWVRTDGVVDSDKAIINKGNDRNDPSYMLGISRQTGPTRGVVNGRIATTVNDYDNRDNDPANEVPPNVWAYIATRYDGTQLMNFINNGISPEVVSASGNIVAQSSHVVIGRRLSSSYNEYDGAIDELRVSNVARTNAWILASYNSMNAPSSFVTVGVTESIA